MAGQLMSEFSENSVIPYPGGKRLARKDIFGMLPIFLTEMVSPFFGGGTVEWYMAARGTRVHAYDINEELVNFWNQMLIDPKPIADYCERFLDRNIEFDEYKQLISNMRSEKNRETKANMYCAAILNSFAGKVGEGRKMATTSSKAVTEGKIKRIREFDNPNVTVSLMDFKNALEKHPDAFAYMDPPYFGTEKYYKYKDFDHEGLHDALSRRDNWMLLYNDCKQIRKMYNGYRLEARSWKYLMNQGKKIPGKQLIILSKDL